jgi:carboxyl-terminal processing protease
LGEGLAGKFIDPDKNISNWSYENGSATNDNAIITSVANCYHLFNPNPSVAVLTDNYTASSGEAITVAFIGRNKTKSFGDYTYGVSTGNAGYPLRDGAVINLTVTTFADRNGTLYGGKIKPDEIVIGPLKDNPTDSDSVVNTAVKWLKSNF